MGEAYAILLVTLWTLGLASGNCPRDRITSFAQCSFRIHCFGAVRGVTLPDDCRGSTNYPVTVDLTFHEANERFDTPFSETHFLKSVTTLRTSATWPKTNLSFLQNMPLLKHLIMMDNSIQTIEDDAPFYALSRLELIDLSFNNLTSVEELFLFENQPNKLRKLSLAHNAIAVITGLTFEALTSLIELDVSYNLISDLNEEPFFNLTSLEILRLNNNRITNLNGALNNLVNLKHLYMRGNQIQNIDDESLEIINHLETFDISENQVDKLQPILFLRHWQHFITRTSPVCKIILSENQITSLPNGTSKELLSRFTRDMKKHNVIVETKVDLSKNIIENIEYNAFSYILQLVSLDLSNNRLPHFIVNPDDLIYVKYLNLSDNHMSRLYYESFSSMIYLQNLDLSHNRFHDIPDNTFTNNFNLKSVNMTHNEIDHLDDLRVKLFQNDAGVLDLSNNGLTRLYIPRGEGLRLSILVLHSNKITDAAFVNLVYQNELKTLEMNRNHIQKLNASSIRLPLSLTTLDLSNNEIQEIGPSTFHRVSHLLTLYLSHNDLTTIDYGAFQGLAELSNLDLSYNSIHYLDSKALMDLKSLEVLSLASNELSGMDYNSWFKHKFNLKVYLDDNRFTCEWLGRALQDFHNGYSRMRPTVQQYRPVSVRNSLEGIPCVQNTKKSMELVDLRSRYVLADERLLITNQKILEAIQEQTYHMRSFMNRFNINSSRMYKLLKED